MATIERGPLPPLGFGPPRRLSSADRDDLVRRAKEVIDDYMFGAGSWWPAGPRKSARQTIEDLKNFNQEIMVREQFVEDPDAILTSIKNMVDAAIKQITDAMTEERDRIQITPIPPSDPIELPSLKTSPTRIPIWAPQTDSRSSSSSRANEGYWSPTAVDSDSSNARPSRYLRGRLVDGLGRSVSDPTRLPAPPTGAIPIAAKQELNSSGGQPLPVYPVPPIFGGYDPSAWSGDDMSDWFTRWVKPLMQK